MSDTAAQGAPRPAGLELDRRLAEVQDCARTVARGETGLARRGDMDPDDVAQDIALQYCKRLTEPVSLLGWAATATRSRLVDLAERRNPSQSATTSCPNVDAADRVANHMRSVKSQNDAMPNQQPLLNTQMWIHNELLSGRSSDDIDQEIMEAGERYAAWQHAAYPSLRTALAAAYQVLADAQGWREPRPDIPRDLRDYIATLGVADCTPALDREIDRLRELVETLESRFAPRLAQAQPASDSPPDVGQAKANSRGDAAGTAREASKSSVRQKKDKESRQQEGKEGRLILSKRRAGSERAWGTIERIKEENGVITGIVIEVVKGGLILDIGLRGFLPASEIEIRKASSLQEYLGRRLTAKILELDHHRNTVVLSRKAWLKENPIEQRRPIVAFIFAHLPNQIAAGRVTKLISSGVFVSLGVGVEGWIHISELAGRHVQDPKQIIHVGDDIFVKILDMDLDKGRISLSLKQANDAVLVQEFDPTLYGMTVEFDEQGNYKYPEGFDAVTKEWLEGHEDQREKWEKQYTDAHIKWEAHRIQVERAAIDDAAFPSKVKIAGKGRNRAPKRQPRTRRGRPSGSDRASCSGLSRGPVAAPAGSGRKSAG
jgi:predicted RNA-binding protein with RPS1 domain